MTLSESRNLESAGYVYFIRVQNENIFKIGFTTTSPWKRKSALQSSCPYNLEVYGYIKTPAYKFLEYHLHRVCESRQSNLKGEWFNLTEEEADALIRGFTNRHLACSYSKIKMIYDECDKDHWSTYYILYCSPTEIYIDTYSLFLHHTGYPFPPQIIGKDLVISWSELEEMGAEFPITKNLKHKVLNMVSTLPNCMSSPNIIVSSYNNEIVVNFLISENDPPEVRSYLRTQVLKWCWRYEKDFDIEHAINKSSMKLIWPEDAHIIKYFQTYAIGGQQSEKFSGTLLYSNNEKNIQFIP